MNRVNTKHNNYLHNIAIAVYQKECGVLADYKFEK